MPDSESPQPHSSRIGDAVATSAEAAKTLAGFTPAQAQTLMLLGLVLFICVGAAYFGNLSIQNQREGSKQSNDAIRESMGLLARTMESDGEKNRQAIESNTKLMVQSNQAIAIALGKLLASMTGLEARLTSLDMRLQRLEEKI